MPRPPVVDPEASPGERWISFLRGYGPVNRVDGMFAEALPSFARAYGVEPLLFPHPSLPDLEAAISPEDGRLTNVILTGTAGDGKTTLCNLLWEKLGGSKDRRTGRNRANYGLLEVSTPRGPRRLHFIFEFTGWAPQGGQPWRAEQLDLLERFAASVASEDPEEVFILAANDGKLVQVWDTIETGGAAELKPVIETLLAEERRDLGGRNLLLLNLSRLSTAELVHAALDCLLAREEWSCFEREAEDPAFAPTSPLTRNFRLLQSPEVRERLLALAELIDCNGLHVPIREVLLLLVNGLLGSPRAAEKVMTFQELRMLASEDDVHHAALYANLFGSNLAERPREQYAVFRHLGAFRVGYETTNAMDSLLVFGRDDDNLKARHAEVLDADPAYAQPPGFEELRRTYLEAEEERLEGAPAFLEALVRERQRLFFRLPEGSHDGFDPWKLTVFHNAGTYRRQVLAPLAKGRPVDLRITKLLVRGLNRIWTGMMAGDLDSLYLSTGLDRTDAPISDIHLYEVPILRGLHGEEVTVVSSDAHGALPVLRVSLGATEHVSFPLYLTRYEFLLRVADGALPSSFSKECSEDVLAFKSQVLSRFYAKNSQRRFALTLLSPTAGGRLDRRPLGVSP